MVVSVEKRVPLGARTTPEAKENLEVLARLISEEMGTRVSLSQALEIAISEAVARRKRKN